MSCTIENVTAKCGTIIGPPPPKRRWGLDVLR
jgi:hypothetical protein